MATDDTDMDIISGFTEKHENRDRKTTRKRRSVLRLYSNVTLCFGLLCILQATLNTSLRLYQESPWTKGRERLMDALGDLTRRGWLYFDHSLYFISTTERNWTASRDDCLQRNAVLIVINSIEEHEFVSRLKAHHWIGLSDRDTEGTWKWVDGTNMTSSFWGPGEPGDNDGEEDCAVAGGNWSDERCDRQHYWICEKVVVLEDLEAELNKEEKEEELWDGQSANRTAKLYVNDTCEVTLDPNTAYRYLSLSENNRTVMQGGWQSYPDHPERFDSRYQVLCRESLTGRCYWEVEREGDVFIAVTYKGITRKGEGYDSMLGMNSKSWSLSCYDGGYAAWYNGSRTDIRLPPPGSNRVGVYVDRPAGTLSFYRVGGDTLTHIHTFQAKFTQEDLLPGFGLGYNSSVSLSQSPARV